MSKQKILVIVDPQNDFIEGGSLAVEGAKKAMTTLAAHVRAHHGEYDKIIVSLDTHHVTNLGFPQNWAGDTSRVIPGQPFPLDDVKSGKVYPKLRYTAAEDAQTVLTQPGFMCWPMHCVKGTPGWKIFSELEDALMQVSKDKVIFLTKGEEDARDNYSIFHFGDRGLTKHANPFKLWDAKYDNPDVYVTGLALDYCVYETVKSLQEISREGTYTIYTSMTASIQPQDIVSEMYERLPKKVNLKL